MSFDEGSERCNLVFDQYDGGIGGDGRPLTFSAGDLPLRRGRVNSAADSAADSAANGRPLDFTDASDGGGGGSVSSGGRGGGGGSSSISKGDEFVLDTREEREQSRPRSFAGHGLVDRQRRSGGYGEDRDQDLLLHSADMQQHGRGHGGGKKLLMSIPGRVSESRAYRDGNMEEEEEEDDDDSDEGSTGRDTFVAAPTRSVEVTVKNTGSGQNLEKAFASLASKSVERALQDFFFGDHEDAAGDVGYKLPAWVPDDQVTECPVCFNSFSTFFRKHHCRLCGKVICGPCSAKRKPAEGSISNGGGGAALRWPWREPVRVCNGCWEKVDLRIQVTQAVAVLQRAAERVEPHEAENLKWEVTDAIDAGIEMHEQQRIMKLQALSISQEKRLGALGLPTSDDKVGGADS
jgi:hypothetical protein